MNITIHSRAIGSQNTQTVNARELHAFLEVGKVFAAWIKYRIEQYGFIEGVDYVLTDSKTGIRQNVLQKDYHLSIDMAKELAMLENNDKGREVRRYFIECERRLKAQTPTPSPALATPLTADLAAIEMLARFLNVSESGKVVMAKAAIEHHSPHLPRPARLCHRCAYRGRCDWRKQPAHQVPHGAPERTRYRRAWPSGRALQQAA